AFARPGRASLAPGRWPMFALPATCRQATRAFVAFAIGGSVGEEPAKLADVPGTRRDAPTHGRRGKTAWSTNGSPLDMCRQMAPPQKALLRRPAGESLPKDSPFQPGRILRDYGILHRRFTREDRPHGHRHGTVRRLDSFGSSTADRIPPSRL